VIFTVTILGSNAAVPVLDKYPSAQIINIDHKYYLIDCGEGTQFQMLKYGIPKDKINQIFISHLHGDHVFGLIGLITSYHLAGRNKKLEIFAPSGIEEIIKVQLRSTGKEELCYQIVYHIVDTEVHQLVFEDKLVCVYSIPLIHRVPTSGYLFKEKQRAPKINKAIVEDFKLTPEQIKDLKNYKSIIAANGERLLPEFVIVHKYTPVSYAYCSDTAFNPAICEFIKGIDLLYHEATFLTVDNDQAIKSMHSTAKDAATIALQSNVKGLIIGHFSARYRDHDLLLQEAEAIFQNTSIADEGNVYHLDA